MKKITKSLVLSIIVFIVNFIAYLTFRLFFFKTLSISESLGYTIWVSILDFIIIFIVSYYLFGGFKR